MMVLHAKACCTQFNLIPVKIDTVISAERKLEQLVILLLSSLILLVGFYEMLLNKRELTN